MYHSQIQSIYYNGIMKLICAVLLTFGVLSGTAKATTVGPTLPNSHFTPGDTSAAEGGTTDEATVCHRSTRTVRNVSAAEKKQVYSEYGIPYVHGWGEVDHLISLELGGSNDIKNLWPEQWHIMTSQGDSGAKRKDLLENRLHNLVCVEHKLTLQQAQDAIRTNWIAAYHRYM